MQHRCIRAATIMDVEIVIRPAVREDADQIAATHIASWGAGYRHIFPTSILDDPEFHANRYATWQGWTHSPTPDRRLWVAIRDNRVAGFALTGHEEDAEKDPSMPSSELIGFYAHPDAWGTGVATALMDASLEHLSSLGRPHAVLWTMRDARRARAFYEKSGWRVTGRVDVFDRFPEHPVPTVEYEIDLAVPTGV